MVDTPVVMSAVSQLVDGSRTVGIAYIDAATRRLGAAQFDDDEQMCALERVLVQLGAKEVVIPQVRTCSSCTALNWFDEQRSCTHWLFAYLHTTRAHLIGSSARPIDMSMHCRTQRPLR